MFVSSLLLAFLRGRTWGGGGCVGEMLAEELDLKFPDWMSKCWSQAVKSSRKIGSPDKNYAPKTNYATVAKVEVQRETTVELSGRLSGLASQ